MSRRILGIDPSLTGTSLCVLSESSCYVSTIRPRAGVVGHERLALILSRVKGTHAAGDFDLVVIEGPAYSRQAGQSGHHERAGLWWLITHYLWSTGRPCAVVTPGGRAKYATGRGNAGKNDVLLAVERRYGHLVNISDDNQADALVLAAMGAHHLGWPVVDVPAINAAALAAVPWPVLPSDEPWTVTVDDMLTGRVVYQLPEIDDINPYTEEN